MTELEVKRCVVSNLRTGEMAVVQLGQGESHLELFPSLEDTHLLVEMDMGRKEITGTIFFPCRLPLWKRCVFTI